MRFLILLVTLFIFSAAPAQSLTDAIFTKYGDKNGVSILTDVVSLPKDSAVTVPLSMTVKTLTVENYDETKRIDRLTKQIVRDCNKVLSQKDYLMVSIDKDDLRSHKVYKYQSGNTTEIFELEQEDDRLTLTVTKITGNANGKVDFKIQTAKGLVESRL